MNRGASPSCLRERLPDPLPLVSAEPSDVERWDNLACLRGISERPWLATVHRGGRLLQLHVMPRPHDRMPEHKEWTLPDGYDGPVEFEDQGAGPNLCRIPRPGECKVRARGAIAGFTRQSRMRLLCKINAIASKEIPAFPKFITLTYPRELLPGWQWGKRQLNLFFQRFFKKWGRCAVIWRMEFQEDGAMHFHILAFIKRFIPWWELAKLWDELIGNQVDPWQSASTQIKQVKGWRQTCAYVAKYIAKDSDVAAMDIFHGRHWGVRFWSLLPVHRVIVALTEAEGFAVRRWIRRYRLARGVKTRDFGSHPPFCGQREIGITMFASALDVVRMLRLLRGYEIKELTG